MLFEWGQQTNAAIYARTVCSVCQWTTADIAPVGEPDLHIFAVIGTKIEDKR